MDSIERMEVSPKIDTHDAERMKRATLDLSYSLVESSDNETRKHERKEEGISSYSRLESDWWFRELASLFPSYVFLVGIVIVLRRYGFC